VIDWLAANWTELVGFATGLACVFLAARRNIWNFPIGLANNVAFLALFASAGLYAAAGLQVVYGALAIHGWVRWGRRVEHDREYIARTPVTHVKWLALAFLAMGAAIAWVLMTFTDSSVAIADASTTSASLVAQYLLNRKRIESWFVWIAVDVAFVALAIASGLWITAGLYLVFIVLCVYGYRSWRAIEQHTIEQHTIEQDAFQARDSGEHSTADAPRQAHSSGKAIHA
jgi:nicotinamide mononucleotide transporter